MNSRPKLAPQACAVSGTGFSREEAGMNATRLRVCHPTHSRLKPVPQSYASPAKASPTGVHAVSGTGFSREEAGMNATRLRVCHPTHSRLKPVPQAYAFPAKASPTGLRCQWDWLQPGRGRCAQLTASPLPARIPLGLRCRSDHAASAGRRHPERHRAGRSV